MIQLVDMDLLNYGRRFNRKAVTLVVIVELYWKLASISAEAWIPGDGFSPSPPSQKVLFCNLRRDADAATDVSDNASSTSPHLNLSRFKFL